MTQPVDRHVALQEIDAAVRRDYDELLAQHRMRAAKNSYSDAADWIVSIEGVIGALGASGGTFLQHAPVVIHGDLAGAQHIVVRAAEPSLALREEIRSFYTAGYTEKEKDAKLHEATGRKLKDVFAASAALAESLGEGYAVLTAPSPSTHDMPQDARDAGQGERSTNANRHLEAIKAAQEFAVGAPTITLLLDDPDPRIAANIMANLEKEPEVAGRIDNIAVVGGTVLTRLPSGVRERVIALPASYHAGVTVTRLGLNQRLADRYPRVPEATERPLLAVPRDVPLHCIDIDDTAVRSALIARSLRPLGPRTDRSIAPAREPAPPRQPTVASEPPRQPSKATALRTQTPTADVLTADQQRILSIFRDRGLTHAVTGVVALRLHAHAAGADIPLRFSPRGYPGMEVALDTDLTNLNRAKEVLGEIASKGGIFPLRTPGYPGFVFSLDAEPPKVGSPLVQAFYGADGPDSYPRDVQSLERVTVQGLEISIPPLFEVAKAVSQRTEAMMRGGHLPETQGISTLGEISMLVKAISRAQEARSESLARRTAPSPPGPWRPGSSPPGKPHRQGL